MSDLITIHCPTIRHNLQALRDPMLFEVLYIMEQTPMNTNRAHRTRVKKDKI